MHTTFIKVKRITRRVTDGEKEKRQIGVSRLRGRRSRRKSRFLIMRANATRRPARLCQSAFARKNQQPTRSQSRQFMVQIIISLIRPFLRSHERLLSVSPVRALVIPFLGRLSPLVSSVVAPEDWILNEWVRRWTRKMPTLISCLKLHFFKTIRNSYWPVGRYSHGVHLLTFVTSRLNVTEKNLFPFALHIYMNKLCSRILKSSTPTILLIHSFSQDLLG